MFLTTTLAGIVLLRRLSWLRTFNQSRSCARDHAVLSMRRPHETAGGHPGGLHVVERQAAVDGAELDVLRAGVLLMALHALGNIDLAEEVAQETIVRAFHALRTSRPDKLGPFVAGIARHVIADIIRARPREVSLDNLTPDAEAQTQRDPLTALCDEQERTQVHRALGLLSTADRELLRLVFFEELSPSQIAQRLRVPAERIRQRKLRALARLRRAFEQSAAQRHDRQVGATIKHGTTVVVKQARKTE